MKREKFQWFDSYACYAITYFCYFLVMALFGSVLSVYLTGIGKSATEMSFIISAAGLFSFVMMPVVGYLNDLTQNPKLISRILLIATGVLGLVFAMCREVWALFLLDGLIMSCINCLMPICERMASCSKYRYGTIRVWGTLGYAAGAQGAGLAIQFLPPMALFIMIFIACGLTLIGFSGTADIVLPPPEKPEEAGGKPRLSLLLKNRQFLLYVVVAMLFAGCSGVNMNYTPVLLTSLGVPTGGVGTVLFFSTLVEIPLILYSHKFMDRFSGKALMGMAYIVIIVQFLFYGFSHSAGVVVTVMISIKAIASTLFVMITLKIVRNVLAPELTTTGLAVVNAMNSLSTIVLQNTGGVIVDASNVHILYLCLGAVSGTGLILTLFLKVKNGQAVFN